MGGAIRTRKWIRNRKTESSGAPELNNDDAHPEPHALVVEVAVAFAGSAGDCG
jgi:hypothetical protein